MDCSNLDVREITDYLPNCSIETVNVPVMSSKSAEIFSKIYATLPDSTESLLSLQTIDKSAIDITAKVQKVRELQKHETGDKVLSVLSIIGTVVLIAAVVAICVAVPLLLGAPAAAGITALTGTIGYWVSLFALIGSGLFVRSAFNHLPEARKDLKVSIDLAKVNHEKLKNYFNTNYETLKSEIIKSIDHKNNDLEIMTEMHQKFDNIQKELVRDAEDLETALIQLKNLHHFYKKSAFA